MFLTGSSNGSVGSNFSSDISTSLETEAEIEEDTWTQFDFVEETLQITDVHVSV